MFFVQNAFVRQYRTAGIGWLCAAVYPIEGFVKINVNCSRIGVWVVRTQTFNEAAISWCACVCHYDIVKRTSFFTMSLQSDLSCHFKVLCVQHVPGVSFSGDAKVKKNILNSKSG